MQKFADENKMGARQIVVLDNPKKTLPCGWNVLLDNYTGEAVIRVDAHAHIPVDFVSKNVKVLEEGEMVVGGVRPNIVDEETPWKDTLLLAESSMFGSSIAPYRNGGNGTEEKIYINLLYQLGGKTMKIIGVIPARYKSSRFPGKPLADICGKPMIWWVYQQCKKVKDFSEVYVATDDDKINVRH